MNCFYRKNQPGYYLIIHSGLPEVNKITTQLQPCPLVALYGHSTGKDYKSRFTFGSSQSGFAGATSTSTHFQLS